MKLFTWHKGRQETAYWKMLLGQNSGWLFFMPKFDCYLLKFPTGSSIPPHVDPVTDKRHYRLNIVLRKAKKGGEFIVDQAIVNTPRIKLFRPDVSEHQVTEIQQGTRYLLSIGWILNK